MKRPLTLKTAGVGLAALALSLTACGTPNDPETTGSEPTEPVEIAYLHRLPDGEGMTLVADIVARWNEEHPEIQVTATKFDGNAQEMVTRLETDINANSGPCLAQLSYNEIPDMYTKGLVMDVTAEADKYKSNYGGAFTQMTINGETIGLPQDSGPLVYMYNATEFAALGIEVPTTLDEFKAAAATAAAAGKYIGNFMPDEVGFWLSAQTAAAGGGWYDSSADAWTVSVESDAATVVADFWQEMIDAKTVLTLNRWGDPSPYDLAVLNGQLIGNIVPAWEINFALNGVAGTGDPFEGQWRVAQIPDFGAGAKTGPDGGSGVAVMKGCAYPAQAMEFNNWFNTQVDDLLTQVLPAAVQAPSAMPENMRVQFGGQDVLAELVTANENLVEFAYIPGFASVVPKLVETAATVSAGSGKVADVFAAGQTASVDALTALDLPVNEG